MNMDAFWSKPSVKVETKPTWEVVSTGEVLWSARLNTNKVTANRQEDRSSQCEATKSVGLRQQGWSSSTLHRDRSQRRRTATVRHLICITSGVGDWMADIVTVIDITTPRWRLKSEDRSLRSCERAQLLAFARLQSLVLWHFQLQSQPIGCIIV